MTDLRERLLVHWQLELAEGYRTGRLPSRTMFLAEWYRLLHGNGYPPYEVWVSPSLIFPPLEGVIFDQLTRFQVQQGLAQQEPALLITSEEVVVAILELDFAPGGFVDYRPAIRRLAAMSQLSGHSSLRLRLNPQSGSVDAQHAFRLHADMLCVYAVVTKKDALALQTRHLHEEIPAADFPPHFVHLKGAVRSNGTQFVGA